MVKIRFIVAIIHPHRLMFRFVCYRNGRQSPNAIRWAAWEVKAESSENYFSKIFEKMYVEMVAL